MAVVHGAIPVVGMAGSSKDVTLPQESDEEYEYDEHGMPIGYYYQDEDDDHGDGEWERAGEIYETPAILKSVTVKTFEKGKGKKISLAGSGGKRLGNTKKGSDIPDHVYRAQGSLNACWDAALVDFKYMHPDRFAPLTEAPRSQAQKHLLAPLWYGPAPPSAVQKGSSQNSILLASSSSLNAAHAESSSSPCSVSLNLATNPSETGSSKKRTNSKNNRNKAKRRKQLDKQGQDDERDGHPKSKLTLAFDNEPDEYAWSPQSPVFQREELIPFCMADRTDLDLSSSSRKVEGEVEMDSRAVGPPVPASSSLLSSMPSSLPTPIKDFLAVAPPTPPASLRGNTGRISYPKPPPPVVPLDDEEDLKLVETASEDLMQNALWAWYNAGYQTAMYHAKLTMQGAGMESEIAE